MTAPRLPDFPASRAVLIGVAGYEHPELADLPAVAENLSGLRAVLSDTERSGFAEPDMVHVLDPADARAAMTPVVEAATAATDLVLVYFAGHGLLSGDHGDLHLALAASAPEEPWTSLPFGYLARVQPRPPLGVELRGGAQVDGHQQGRRGLGVHGPELPPGDARGQDVPADELEHGLVGLAHVQLELGIGAVEGVDHDPCRGEVARHKGKARLEEALQAAAGILF